MSFIFWILILYFYNPISPTNATSRLPRSIKPLRYVITITPYFAEKHPENKQFTFDGFASIRFRIVKNTNKIVFHYKNLRIDEKSLYVNEMKTSKRLHVVKQIADELQDFYTVVLDKPLLKGRRYVIGMDYTANFTDSLTGFYKSSYVTKDNETRWLAVTQFEEIHAREAFPCFDEPDFKAIFDIRINRLPNYMSLSNMPKIHTIINSTRDGREMDVYKSSLKMSSYLVAFAVTDFKSISNKFGNHTIWTQEKLIGNAKYSLDLAEDLLRALEQFLQTDYQLPKLDHIALPLFEPAGMENWGLITYREKFLLYDPNENTVDDLRTISETIAHEVSHMWFGNQVTCKWWTYMWLNEGFATYFQKIALSLVNPDWRLDELYSLAPVHESLFVDGPELNSIEMNDSEFDPLLIDVTSTYGKAGAVLRMIENILTMPVFRTGLISYLKEMNGKSVTDNDLWRNLQKEVDKHKRIKLNLGGLTVSEIAKTWIKKSGYPLVNVERINSTTIKISQNAFPINLANRTTENSKFSDWWIPINYATGEDPDFSDTTAMLWLGKHPKYIRLDESDWIIFNKHQTGFYRVKYDPAIWKNIMNMLLMNNELIPPVNRGQLIDDIYTLSLHNYIELEEYFNLMQYLKNEKDLIPWMVISTHHKIFTSLLDYSNENVTTFKENIRNVISGVYETVGIEESPSDNFATKLKRMHVITVACQVQYEKCLHDANIMLSKLYTGEITAISPNLQSTVFKYGSVGAMEQIKEFLFERFKKTKSVLEQTNIVAALAQSPKEPIFLKLFNYLIDNDANELSGSKQFEYLQDLLTTLKLESFDACATIFVKNFDIFEKGMKSEKLSIIFKFYLEQFFEDFMENHPGLAICVDNPKKHLIDVTKILTSIRELNENNS